MDADGLAAVMRVSLNQHRVAHTDSARAPPASNINAAAYQQRATRLPTRFTSLEAHPYICHNQS
jgi:hypothetical protein